MWFHGDIGSWNLDRGSGRSYPVLYGFPAANRVSRGVGRVARSPRPSRGVGAGGVNSMGWLKPRPECKCTREHTLAPLITLERRTLAQRLEDGRLSAAEALPIAVEVA